jgi:fumarate reductase flavoprotein subunit
LLRLGGTILCDAKAQELLLDKDGRVTGVNARVSDEQFAFQASRGVVLATGDYANSSELIARHKGVEFAHIEGIDETATGDGHLLADAVGARLVNMDVTYGPEIRFVPPPHRNITQLLPSGGLLAKLMGRVMPLVPQFLVHAMIKRLLVTWQHPENALFDDGAILINRRGERFTNEKRCPEREVAIANQPEKICYILLDERLIEHYSAWPHFISTAPKIAYAYARDYLRLRPDVAISGKSLAALAHERALPASAVEETVHKYNRYVTGEIQDPHGRNGDTLPLKGDRWLLLGPAKAYFTTTEGGTSINRDFQVISEAGEPIEGLYAVGQVGLNGMILWGHGLHIAWALTSGRLAGAVVAGKPLHQRQNRGV